MSVARSFSYFGPTLPIFRFLDKDDEAGEPRIFSQHSLAAHRDRIARCMSTGRAQGWGLGYGRGRSPSRSLRQACLDRVKQATEAFQARSQQFVCTTALDVRCESSSCSACNYHSRVKSLMNTNSCRGILHVSWLACLLACLPACLLACPLACLLARLLACCLPVCLPVCLPACLPGCLPACLFACLPACLLYCLLQCLLVCLLDCLPACLTACLTACLAACLSACLVACCLLACLPACLLACLPACLLVYLVACLPFFFLGGGGGIFCSPFRFFFPPFSGGCLFVGWLVCLIGWLVG